MWSHTRRIVNLMSSAQLAFARLAIGTSPCQAADADPAASAAPLATAFSAPLPLFDGHDLDAWWIDPAGLPARIDHGELVVQLEKGKAFHAEIGGMDWDDYEVAGEFRVDQDPRKAGSGFVNLQFCPHDTMIFAQLIGGSVTKIAFVDADGGRPFVECIQARVVNPAHEGEWHRFAMLASGGVVATRVDGIAATAAVVPIGTKGMFGILANFADGIDLRLRSLTIAFHQPTTTQLQEYARPAVANWERWIAARQAAGDARPYDPKAPGRGLDVPDPAKPPKAANAGF